MLACLGLWSNIVPLKSKLIYFMTIFWVHSFQRNCTTLGQLQNHYIWVIKEKKYFNSLSSTKLAQKDYFVFLFFFCQIKWKIRCKICNSETNPGIFFFKAKTSFFRCWKSNYNDWLVLLNNFFCVQSSKLPSLKIKGKGIRLPQVYCDWDRYILWWALRSPFLFMQQRGWH